MHTPPRPAAPRDAHLEPSPLVAPVLPPPPQGPHPTPPRHLLVVEDHPTARALLTDSLEASGYVVHQAGDGRTALALLPAAPVALVILDLMLPDLDGLAVCQAIQALRPTPTLVLSARGDEARKVALLAAGADDYLVKPVGVAELRARIQVLLRRGAPTAPAPQRVVCGDLVVVPAERQVTRRGVRILLTPTEWQLLAALCRHQGQLQTTRQLLAQIWPDAHLREVPQLQACVSQLRKKLGEPDVIETVRGVGYRLRHDDAL